MLLFRGTGWHKGLSSETVHAVMNQWDAWFEQLVEQGRATSGRPLAYQGKIVSGKKGLTVIDDRRLFLLHVENEEEAIEIAKHCPGLEHGVHVEVRPVVEFCPSGELATQAAEQLPVELPSDKAPA
jgi:hypothetical protein